jgi:hypothetical protein
MSVDLFSDDIFAYAKMIVSSLSLHPPFQARITPGNDSLSRLVDARDSRGERPETPVDLCRGNHTPIGTMTLS